jgi:hypothetical protein
MKIPLPERGQPIDLNYLSEIAKSINQISNSVLTSNTTSVVDNKIQPADDVTTNKLRFYAVTTPIQNANVNAGTSQNWSVAFKSDFLFTPVAVATVQNNTASTAGNNVTLVIKNITTGTVEGNVLYNVGGSIDININVIAIGVSR